MIQMILQKLKKNKLLIAVLLMSSLFQVNSFFVYAQTSSISGLVQSKSSKETIIGANVYIKSINKGARTNKEGFYSITKIPSGEYIITITSICYNKLVDTIKLAKGQSLRKDFLLEGSSFSTGQINVIADREVEKRAIPISQVNIPIQQIKEIRIGGESDVFRSIQYLPGVLSSSQISSGLYIRGGSPDQNLVLLDGATVYNPSHLFGFISSFNSDALKDVELIKGGYPAEYGGRLSAVLNITQKDGNRENVEGVLNIGAISSKLSLEGPIGNGSWFVGGRRTYFELLKAAIPDDPTNPLPDFNFYDLNAKISQNFGDNDKILLSAFNSQDHLAYSSFGVGLDLTLANQAISGKWTHIFGDDLFSNVLVSGSKYTNNFRGDNSGYKFLIDNSIQDYTAKVNFEWFTDEFITTKFGLEINNYTFNYLQNFTGETDSTQSGSSGGTTNFQVKDWNYAAFASVNYQIDSSFSIQTGLRATYFDLAKTSKLDPRISFKYQINDDLAIKLAYGIYHQNLKLATNPDFSFFDTWLGTDSSLNISKSTHYIVSFDTKPIDGYDFNVDFYYKDYQFINELNRNAIKIVNGADALFEGKGYSYGAEVFVQKKIGDFTGWAGYGFGYVIADFDSINLGNEFRPKYDRRHDFKVVMQYHINDTWEVGANFMLQSGQSYTGATSRWQLMLPGQNVGVGKIVPSDRYGLRLPASHQLNVNASYKTTIFGLNSKIVLDIFNLYNRRDIWFRFYNTSSTGETKLEDVKLLPIIPTFSIEIKF